MTPAAKKKARSRLAHVGLPWAVFEEVAAFSGMNTASVYQVATGIRDWRRCQKAMVPRLLLTHGWTPAGGTKAVKAWLDAKQKELSG